MSDKIRPLPGVCYGKGRGVQKDLAKAAEWYEKSATQGDAMAQFRLALCYATGKVRTYPCGLCVVFFLRCNDMLLRSSDWLSVMLSCGLNFCLSGIWLQGGAIVQLRLGLSDATGDASNP